MNKRQLNDINEALFHNKPIPVKKIVDELVFAAGLTAYIKRLQESSDERFRTDYPNTWANGQAPKYEFTQGQKWVKVLTVDVQRSVFCFIDPQTGDIYKAATFNAPAKGVRGNIFDEKDPLTLSSMYR